jgi:predicted DNA-binding transcriptional regulator AlpA
MAEPEAGKLYTLSEISQKTGISMPTLQRYKKTYQARIPSVGQGRKQRYPDSALPVFDEIKNENAGKRGRPRKDPNAPRPERPAASKRRGRPAKSAGSPGRKAAAAASPAAAKRAGGRGRKAAAAAPPAAPARRGRPAKAAKAAKGGSGNLMTLTQISETTGISYPTLVRYVRMHADRLPSEGKGRARRFYPQAVDVFRQLRQESGRGGRKAGSGTAAAKSTGGRGRGRAAAASSNEGTVGAALQQRLKQLEKTQQSLEKKLKGFVDSIQKLFR